MFRQQLPIIHPIDMISGEDQDIFRFAPFQQMAVLMDGISGSNVPCLPHLHLGGDGCDKLPNFGIENGPAIPQMFVEGV